jgi:tRNA (adenine57-N1/adenine58-N1)-methyltransferase catalytic subunit
LLGLNTKNQGKVFNTTLFNSRLTSCNKIKTKVKMTSSFLTPGSRTAQDSLALISFGRDHLPAILKGSSADDPAGEITNTRFGSYPHSTLLGLPWGSQVLASNVGFQQRQRGKKRKREQQLEKSKDGEEKTSSHDRDEEQPAIFAAAASGFAHVLPPTPEFWTTSLPHRTQVVYTPDYSYILQRIRARPGSRLIEAGAGSGSFTHAAARAVFNGYPAVGNDKHGKVFSFEYHQPRYEALQKEIATHGLSSIVTVTHRDIYEDGFKLVSGASPRADAIFLDLPAPW